MSTRKTSDPSAPVAQERYMSSVEYSELRGISATAAAAKVAMLTDQADRNLIMFLQALSHRPGGLGQVVTALLSAWPERLGTPTMHKEGIRPGKVFSAAALEKIGSEITTEEELHAAANAALAHKYLRGAEAPAEQWRPTCDDLQARCAELTSERLERFLIEFCINPRCKETFPYFLNVKSALNEFRTKFSQEVANSFCRTQISKFVFDTLEAGLALGKPVMVEGESQIGKTTATQAFVEQHLDRARLVSLSGVSNKTNTFRAIAQALGITSSYARKANELQTRIEDVLQKTKIMIVFDEAHYLFAQGTRITTRPELIDWVNTALYNRGVPYALVATPQFMKCLDRVERRVGWNSDQFKGRMRRWKELPETAPRSDLEAVAGFQLGDADRRAQCIALLVGYALTSKRYLPAIAHAIEEARLIATEHGRNQIGFNDIEQAIERFCVPSEKAKARTFNPTSKRKERGINEPFKGRETEAQTDTFVSARGIAPAVHA
jgi:hypothetical protein